MHGSSSTGKFVLGPVTPAYAGTYRCYGFNYQSPDETSAHSDPLKIIISVHIKKEQSRTLSRLSAENRLGRSQANFKIGPVTPDHAGTYTCYGSYNPSPYEWSDSSDPIDIKITGLYKKPSLSALMSPVVMSGENVTLSCISDHQFDMFHLSREGVPLGQGLPAMQSHNRTFQANFLLGPVIWKGNYRCYGSFSNSSHVWSSPSDPWYLPVTDNHWNLHILIGLSVTMILVVLIIIILNCYCCSGIKRKSQEQASERHLSSVRNQHQRNTAIMDQDSEVRATLNRQDPERQEVQEVTYLKFDQMIFKQILATPNSQIHKEFSTNPSLYLEVRK
ncbi:killer cell immunoglobulin-like receptor 3DL1 [Peromyscus leucopus]|uniref:killer cell immunoglobulin-like receptor 3DL1 n=1 Tax=Peromyscus leucopus TaxID=10041 RepID=UPI001885508A|nr:killer cell immunoglobulin-like receptor 3DL1 [Peromyscus leucopus]